MRKIDIHCHTTNRPLTHLSGRSATISTLKSEMKKHDVVHSNLLATYFPHRESGVTNFRLRHWIRGMHELTMFGSLDFEHYFKQGMSELEELAEEHAISGIKIYTGYQQIDLHGKKFGEVVDFAQQHAHPLMFHAGYSHTMGGEDQHLVLASEVAFVTEKGVPVIISHLAKPNIDDLIATVNHTDNLYADMSGLFISGYEDDEKPQAIEDTKRFLEHCGPQKLLFGTDFPLQSHKDSIDIVEKAMDGFRERERSLVYYDNAQAILKRRTL